MRLNLALLALLLPAVLVAQDLEIHHLDVDQADATLLVMPNGATLLVDGGETNAHGQAIAAYLKAQGINRLDGVVNTHFHDDHLGGLDALVGAGITVDQWWDRGGSYGDCPPGNRREFCRYADVAVNRQPLHPGWMLLLDPDVTIYVVAGSSRVRYRDPYDLLTDWDEENDRSVALLVGYRGFNYFLGGDLEEEVERRLVMEAAVGDIDVYQANHHGSHTSSTEPFLDMLRPEVVVISNGSHGNHHHPRAVTLQNFAARGIEVYQTNRYARGDARGGNVSDATFILDLEPSGSDGAIVITVRDPAGEYDVLNTRTGQTRTYLIQRPAH